MNNLFDKTDSLKITERISRVTPDSKALWGKMNAAEMLYHLRQPLLAGIGEVKLKRTFIGFLFGGIAKKQVLSDKPFKKGLPTDKNFKPNDKHDFEREKSELTAILSRLADKGQGILSGEPHPFFGKLTPDEWNKLNWKHIDHHLSQFGV